MPGVGCASDDCTQLLAKRADRAGMLTSIASFAPFVVEELPTPEPYAVVPLVALTVDRWIELHVTESAGRGVAFIAYEGEFVRIEPMGLA